MFSEKVRFGSVRPFATLAVVVLSGCATSAEGPSSGGGGGSAGSFFQTGGSGPTNCQASPEFGCGGAPAGSGGSGPGSGGSSPGGGAPGGGGSAGAGAGSGTGGIGVPGTTIVVCEGQTPPNIPPDSFPSCTPIAGCGVSRCVPVSALPKGVPADLLGQCGDAQHVCVPDEYIKTYGEFLAKTCTSLAGVEGRCISTCVPQVNGLMDALPQDVCGDAERCAPCINPNDGTDTGACSQGCDPGPKPETTANPLIFPTCQTDGRCVPQDIVPKALLNRLTILTNTGCTDTSTVCAPVVKTQNLKYNFASCVPGSFAAIGAPNTDSTGVVTQWGGCVPAWLAGGEAAFLAQMTCKAGELCAPCHDPLTPNPNVPIALEDPTGACPVPLPTDPNGGNPPDGSGGVAGIGGTPVVWGTPGTGAAPATGGSVGAGGTTGAGGSP
ncbi:MAG TPA: hypothetical protein VHE30_07715 [Polyangiaceae bacterium]|nr:hypothetical protein [Polyangiaceae bacterium]